MMLNITLSYNVISHTHTKTDFFILMNIIHILMHLKYVLQEYSPSLENLTNKPVYPSQVCFSNLQSPISCISNLSCINPHSFYNLYYPMASMKRVCSDNWQQFFNANLSTEMLSSLASNLVLNLWHPLTLTWWKLTLRPHTSLRTPILIIKLSPRSSLRSGVPGIVVVMSISWKTNKILVKMDKISVLLYCMSTHAKKKHNN